MRTAVVLVELCGVMSAGILLTCTRGFQKDFAFYGTYVCRLVVLCCVSRALFFGDRVLIGLCLRRVLLWAGIPLWFLVLCF